MNYYNADTVIEQDREIYRLRLALETANERIAKLERQRSEFDCRYAGPYAETSGVHCPMGQPCQSCQLAAAERERDEARAKLAGVIAERDRFAPFSDDLPVEPLSRPAPTADAIPERPEACAASAMTHELKTWLAPFAAVLDGRKRFEIRRFDRPFAIGDTLLLNEWDEEHDAATGRSVRATVTYIVWPGEFGLPAGLCVMGIAPPAYAATEAVEMLRHLCNVYGCTSYGRTPDHGPDDCSWCEAEALLAALAPKGEDRG